MSTFRLVMKKLMSHAPVLTLFLSLLAFPTMAADDVAFIGNFESGKILGVGSDANGFFVHTVPNPQRNKESVSGRSSDFDSNSGLDTRVVSSETVKGELVKPRAGKYFLRSALYYDKRYDELNGGENKPRSKIYVNGHPTPFDVEGYLGFSIYLPKSWEHETGVRGNRGTAMLLQVQSASASSTLLTLEVYVPSGDNQAHWILKHNLSATSVKGGKSTVYDLGRVNDDLGKWTDFSLRYRFNPFSKRTNAKTEGGKNQYYDGNKGILQLYKSVGAVKSGGNRSMQLTRVNLVNRPVGLVPHATRQIYWHFRVYKYGWHKNDTDVKGPVWVGFDEIRDGRVGADGTSLGDVLPPGMSAWSPKSPTGLVVE